MKNIKLNLGLILIVNTVILFSVTFAAIDYYQKNYIFDKAISSLQNETDYLINEKEFLGHDDETRYFAVDLLFVEDMGALDDYYFLEQEKYFYSLYEKGELIDDEIIKTTNEHGQYYVLLKHVPANIFYDEMSVKEKNNASMPVIFYTDITFATNLVNRLNKIFSAMMLIAIVVEGIVGIYLGTRFEKSQQKLKHFFQNASHELKTPLMSILGYAEGIKTGVIQDSAMASEVIIKQSNKMKLLVDEILNISKLDSKEYVLKREKVDIRDIVEQSLDNFRQLAIQKSIKIVTEIDEVHTEINVDALQIYKAINTIIDNAFKYAVSTVMIKTYLKRNALYVDIYNDGKPIDKQRAAHIFDRFYSTNDYNSGIGLAMAKEILRLSKGDVLIENAKDGVVFKVKIPWK